MTNKMENFKAMKERHKERYNERVLPQLKTDPITEEVSRAQIEIMEEYKPYRDAANAVVLGGAIVAKKTKK